MQNKALEKGDSAPDFSLEAHDGSICTLDDFAGKTLVLYFYPKDNTQGCTNEAKAFSELKNEFADKGAAIAGISPDSVKSHKNFREKHGLDITLLSDPERQTAEKYGAYGVKKMYGREVMGIIRSTFIIRDKVIEKAFYNVRVKGHVDKVLCEL